MCLKEAGIRHNCVADKGESSGMMDLSVEFGFLRHVPATFWHRGHEWGVLLTIAHGVSCTKRSQGFYCCTPDFFDGLTQSCKSVFFHGLSPFLAGRFLQRACDPGSFVQHVAIVKRESVVRTMD